jgi:hypothetical protein
VSATFETHEPTRIRKRPSVEAAARPMNGIAPMIADRVTVHGAVSSDGDFRPAMWASTAAVT